MKFTIHFLSFLIMLSCRFPMDEEFYVELSDEFADQTFEMKLDSDLFGDTITLLDWTQYRFTYNIGFKTLHDVSIHVDGSGTKVQHSDNDYLFEIDPGSYPTGIHQVDISVRSSTGRYNLADRLEAEYLELTKSFWFQTDTNQPNSVKILDVYPENGTLKIVFEKYERINFLEYRLVRESSPPLYYIVIKNPEDTVASDPYFTGGSATYKVEVHVPNNQFSTGPYYNYYNNSGEILSVEAVNSTEARINWTKAAFTHSFGYYRVNFFRSGDGLYKTLEIKDINQTSVITDLNAGLNTRVSTVIFPNNTKSVPAYFNNNIDY